MKKLTTEKVCFFSISHSADNSQIINNALMNSGAVSEYRVANDKHELFELLTNKQLKNYSIILCEKNYPGFMPEDVVAFLKKEGYAHSVIVLEEQGSELSSAYRTEAMKIGISDCVGLKEIDLLVLVMRREAKHAINLVQCQELGATLADCRTRNKELIDSSSAAIAFISEGLHVYANRSYAMFLGYEDEDDVIVVSFLDVVADEDRDVIKSILKKGYAGDLVEESHVVHINVNGDDNIKAKLKFIPAILDDELCIQVTAQKVIEHVNVDERIDPATNLFTRRYFFETVNSAIGSIAPGKQYSLAYITIRDFDKVSRSVGIDKADVLIDGFAKKIHRIFGEDILATRITENAFAIFMPNGSLILSDKIDEFNISLDNNAIEMGGAVAPVKLSTNTGVAAIYSKNSESSVVLTNARGACEAAAADGEKVSVFNPMQDGENGDDAASWREKLLHALTNKQFEVVYQPIFSLNNDGDRLVEALIRLRSNGEYIMPGKFMPVAEEVGMGTDIDKYVLKVLAENILTDDDVNTYIQKVTTQTLHSKDFPSVVKGLIEKYKMNRKLYVCDIHEKLVVNFPKAAKDFIDAMNAIGVGVMISHYTGAEEAKAVMLSTTIRYAKIAPHLLHEAAKQEEKRSSFKALFLGCVEMETTTIAAHIEDPFVLTYIYSSGIEKIQGNFLASPSKTRDFDFQAI